MQQNEKVKLRWSEKSAGYDIYCNEVDIGRARKRN